MGVSALELRPRGAVALFDAGIRLCARSSGLWALGLPGGAIVTAAAQPLMILNIHIAANVVLYVGRKLLAIDLSYAERFVALNNSVWVSAAVLLGFALFEPLRAACATLLLIDGRVRQEGLDLVAASD